MKKAVKKAAPAKRKPAPPARPAKKKSTTKPKSSKKVTAKKTKKSAPKPKAATKKAPPAKPKPVARPKPVAKAPVAAPPPKLPPPPPVPPPAPGGSGQGTRDDPWVLKTPTGNSEFQAFRDEHLDPPALVVWIGATELRYHLRCLTDLHAMLRNYGDWMLLGSADEQQPVEEETVEAWGRSRFNPISGWYGLKPGLRGRLAMYLPPILEYLGLAELEHFPKNNRMRAK